MIRFDLPGLIAASRSSVERPRDFARYLLSLNLPLGAASLALATVALLTAVLAAIVSLVALNAGAQGMAQMSPLQWAFLQMAGMFISAGLIAYAGRWFGGIGDIKGAILLVAWAQFVLLIFQLIQVIVLVLFPPLTPILALLGIVLSLWLLVNFIAELHGFESLIKVFFGILGVGAAVIFGLATILALVMGGAGM